MSMQVYRFTGINGPHLEIVAVIPPNTMAFSSLSLEAVSAIEDAFLRGEWTQALNDSRSILAARIMPVKYLKI